MPQRLTVRDRGFTLVELLIVIVVLGILSAIVLFGVARFRTDATLAACKADLTTVAVAADAYDARNGGFPPDIATLVTGQYLKSAPSSGTYAFNGTAKTVTRTPACSDGTATAGGASTTATATPTTTATPTATTPTATTPTATTPTVGGAPATLTPTTSRTS